jgi:hypothetical protein
MRPYRSFDIKRNLSIQAVTEVAPVHNSLLRFSFILVYFNNRQGSSSLDASSIASR